MNKKPTDDLQVIDWEKSLQHNANNETLVIDLFKMFRDELPQSRDDILAAFTEKDDQQLYQHVHKLHGSCSYCVVPRLLYRVEQVETTLKKNESVSHDKLAPLVEQLGKEIDTVLAAIANEKKLNEL